MSQQPEEEGGPGHGGAACDAASWGSSWAGFSPALSYPLAAESGLYANEPRLSSAAGAALWPAEQGSASDILGALGWGGRAS